MKKEVKKLFDNEFFDQKKISERNLLKTFIENTGYKLIKVISDGVYLAVDTNGRKYVVKNIKALSRDFNKIRKKNGY
ncbi:hypothetical protein Pelsub_P2087 [Pelolinea submarina]|nr:hypothetical protein Pelsub_P2087 [Pelolinea submarina]